MLKSTLPACLALALASPLALATEKPAADKAAAPAAKSAATTSASTQGVKTVAATPAPAGKPATRDWASIDTNKDNLISPDEMMKHLQEQWAAQKKGG